MPALKYDPEVHPAAVIEMGGRGLSITQMAVELKILRNTLYNWAKMFPEFDEAFQMARECSMAYWERILEHQAMGAIQGNATSTIFAMKNRFPQDYRDRHQHNVVLAEVGEIEFIDFLGYEEPEAIEADYEDVSEG